MVRIVRDIVERDLRRGDRLPNEGEMMTQYQVSRASLREAMRLLEVQGLVTLKPGPGGGAFVGEVDHRNLARTITLYLHMAGLTYGELMDSQLTLEGVLATSAAQNPDSTLRRELCSPYLDVPDAVDDDDSYRELTMGFHMAVGKLSTNRTIALLARAVTHAVTMHVTTHMDLSLIRDDILREHAELAGAIIDGREEDVRQGMIDHFRSQHDHFRQRWPERFGDIVERP